MNNKSCSCFCIPSFVLIILGVLVGIGTALAWFFGLIPFVRAMIPYALGVIVVLFAVTAVLKARCAYSSIDGIGSGLCLCSTCASVRKYSTAIIVAGAVFVVFAILVLATFLPFAVRFALAFIGSIAFWIMLFEFVAMIFCMFYKHC